MKPRFAFYILLIVLLSSCQDSTKPNTEAIIVEKSTPETNAPKSTDIGTELTQEKPLSAYAQQFYATNLWHFDAAVVIKNPEKSKEYFGKWVKFNPDNTLDIGFYDEAPQKGKWTLDEANNLLTILEDGEEPTLSEWQVKTSSSSDAIMVWVGTKKFGTNNTQIKMTRHNIKPVKK